MKDRVDSGPSVGLCEPRGPMSDSGHRFGDWSEASGLALRVELRTRLQTTFAITSAIAFRTGWQQTVRIIRQIRLHLAFGIDSQVPVGFAPQTRPETGVEVERRVPFRVAMETALGTVPGTVPTVIPGGSVLTNSTAPKALFFGYLARF